MAVNPCCSLRAAGHCGHEAACAALLCKWKLVLPYRGVLSLNRSWFQLSQADWESPSSHQGTLNKGQGRRQWEEVRESCSGQFSCKGKELQYLFSVMCTITCILLQTLHCFHSVPLVQSRHSTLQDLGIPCRPACGTALVC